MKQKYVTNSRGNKFELIQDMGEAGLFNLGNKFIRIKKSDLEDTRIINEDIDNQTLEYSSTYTGISIDTKPDRLYGVTVASKKRESKAKVIIDTILDSITKEQ